MYQLTEADTREPSGPAIIRASKLLDSRRLEALLALKSTGKSPLRRRRQVTITLLRSQPSKPGYPQMSPSCSLMVLIPTDYLWNALLVTA